MIDYGSNELDITGMQLASGDLSSFDEKNLHLEDNRWNLPYVEATRHIIEVSYEKVAEFDVDPVELLVNSQHKRESSSFGHQVEGQPLYFDTFVRDRRSLSWSVLQTTQHSHDRAYHPDVVGRGPIHHLEHTAKHINATNTKILRAMAAEDPVRLQSAYLNMLIFGIKAATALQIELPKIDTKVQPIEWPEL